MAQQEFFRTGGAAANGSTVLPVTDGDYFTPDLSMQEDESEIYVEFFSDAAGTTPVSPTGGTVTAAARPGDHNYLAAGTNPVIQASECQTPTSSYTPPVLDGGFNKARITLAGITGGGVTHMRAWIYKHT